MLRSQLMAEGTEASEVKAKVMVKFLDLKT